MLKMEERLHAILKFRTAELWDNRNGSLMALQAWVCSHSPNISHDYVMLDRSLLDAAIEETFDQIGDRGGQYSNRAFVVDAEED